MKKNLLLTSFSVICLGGSVLAQQNTLPTVGDVGVGTTTPSAKLDVKGRVDIDSSLVVKDSVSINKNLRVGQNVRFLGEAKMNDVKVLDNFTSNGVSKFNGDVKFTALEQVTNLSNKQILFTNENGLVKSTSYDAFVNALKGGIYSLPAGPQPIDLCNNAGGFSSNPY